MSDADDVGSVWMRWQVQQLKEWAQVGSQSLYEGLQAVPQTAAQANAGSGVSV